MILIVRQNNENVNINNGSPTVIKLVIRNVAGGGGGGAQGYISAGTSIMSLGTAVFSNSNGISFGASGHTITASFSGGGGGAALSAGGNSQNTGTIVFSNSNGVSFGLSNNGILTASVPVATNSSWTVSAGTRTETVGQLIFSNNNGVSFGLTGGTLTATVKTDYLTSQSNQAFSAAGGSSAFQTLPFGDTNSVFFTNTNGSVGVASVKLQMFAVSNTTQSTSGSANHTALSFGGAGAASVAITNGSIIISAPSQTNQNISLFAIGNTTQNSSTLLNASNLSFNAIGSLTVGYSNGSIQLSAPNALTTARASTDAVGLNTAQTNVTWTVNSSGISINASAYLTTADLSQNSSKYMQDWKLTGNTAGTTSSAQGTDLWFSGGNSITVSGSSNTIVFSVGNYITTADLSQNSSKYVQNWKLTGNTAGTTSSAQGTDLWFSGGNSITVSGSSNSIVFSVGNYITTADLSQNSSKYMQNWKLTGNTAGTTSSAEGTDLWFSGGNSITISGSSNSIVFSVGNYITTADLSQNSSKYVQEWALTGNTAGTTSSAQGTRLYLSGGNNMTLSGSSNTIVFSAASQSNQNISFYALGNTTQNSSSVINASVVSYNGLGNMTVGFSNGSIQLSGGTAAAAALVVANSQTTFTSGTANFLEGGGAITIASSAGGQSFKFSVPQTSSLSGTGAVSISVNASTISIGVPYISLTADNGTQQASLSQLYFQNSNGLSFGLSTSNNGSASLTIAEQPVNRFEPYEYNFISSATSTDGIGTMNVMPFVLPRGISFGQIDIMASASVSTNSIANSFSFSVPNNSSLRFGASFTVNNSNFVDIYLFSKLSGGSTTNLATYSSTRNTFGTIMNHSYDASINKTGGNSGSWSVKSSASVSITFPFVTSGTVTSVNAATTVTTWATGYSLWTSSTSSSSSNTYATSAATQQSFTLSGNFPATTAWASFKLVNLNFAGSLSVGEWWIGINRQTSTASTSATAQSNAAAANSYTSTINASAATYTAQLTYLGLSNVISSSLGFLGGNTNSSVMPSPGHGSFSATYDPGTTYVNNAGQANGAIAISDIRSNVSFFKTWIQFNSVRVAS